MNNAEQIIQSKILERFVLGLTSPEENQVVKKGIKQYPAVRQQVLSIKNAMNSLADEYNIPPPPNRRNNDKNNQRSTWLSGLFS